MPLLFSYGTLQQEAVQLSTFGRLLRGQPDELVGFEQSLQHIEDPQFVATSGKAQHAIVRFTGRADSRVRGTVFEVSEGELASADRYEPAGYTRISATLASGKVAWVYADARSPVPADAIRWRLHLSSGPERVFEMLATAAGRRRFWAESAEETGGVIRFRFPGGVEWTGRILERVPPERFAVEYFGGSRAEFTCSPDGAGGTDLVLTETGVPPREWAENHAGWVSVLLTLKAAADFGVDLRNHDPRRTWADGYVDP